MKLSRKRSREGADLERVIEATDIYFDLDGDSVLKIRSGDNGDFLVRFEPSGDGFEKVEEKEVEDLEKRKDQLEEEHGIKSVLQKEMKFYTWRDYTLILNLIEDVGDFLIVEGDEVSRQLFSDLNVDIREIIDVPFSDLKR